MIRTVPRLGPIAIIFAGLLAVSAFAPPRVWANDPGASPAIPSGNSSGNVSEEASRLAVVADFNRDGNPDLIVGDDDGSLTLFLGDGKGNLVAAGNVAHLDSVVSIVVGDFNHDGIPDLAISDWRSSVVVLLLGAGDGSFSRVSSFPLRTPGVAPNLVVADFNRDGIADLAVVYGDDGAYTYDVMLGDGKGNFSRSPELSFVKDPNSHCNT